MKLFESQDKNKKNNTKEIYLWMGALFLVCSYSYINDNFLFSLIFLTLSIIFNSIKICINYVYSLQKANNYLKEDLSQSKKTIAYQKELLQKSIQYTTMGKLSSGFAHQINTPLAAIQLRVDMLNHYIDENNVSGATLKKTSDSITESINRIVSLVSGVRSFVNQPVTTNENYSLNQCLDNALALCHEKIKKSGIDIRYESKQNELSIYGNSHDMTQALFHVIFNSVEAVENIEEKWISINIEDCKENIKVIITDSGKGLDSKVVKNWMNVFVTTKPNHLGIGLSQVKELLNKHKGSIKLDTQAENTKFVITLPKIAYEEVQSA